MQIQVYVSIIVATRRVNLAFPRLSCKHRLHEEAMMY